MAADTLPEQVSVTTISPEVKRALDRGRAEMRRDAAKRRLCMHFEKGDQYAYVNEKGMLLFQPTALTSVSGQGKPPHRIRNTYNHIRPLIEDKISAATARIPSYEVDPSTSDPEAWGAARMSEQVLLYGYDQWRLRRASMKTIKNALAAGGDGFALPYFDENVGPYDQDGAGLGEIKVKVFNGNEVYWEAGCDFEDSPWWATEQAESTDAIKGYPGFLGGVLTPDAAGSDIPTDRPAASNMVMVTNYYERPTSGNPDGQRLQIANARLLCLPEKYPLMDRDDNVLDEPLLHRLSYTVDPDTDRDLGLVWQLIDAQRTIADCLNKLLEWKNRCLNPQMIAAVDSLIAPRDDVPGATVFYRMGMDKPQWETPPPVPQALFDIYQLMLSAMKYIASYQDIDVAPNVAASTSQLAINQAKSRWDSFLGDLAEWHSRLGRHCLLLVSRYYTEPRQMQIRGRFGPYSLKDFEGSQLLGQVQVRVLPSSLKQRTQAELQERLNWIVTNFPGWLSPEVALGALDGGTAQSLIEGFELDIAKVNRILARIRDGSVMDMGSRIDQVPNPDQAAVAAGAAPPTVPQPAPDWMPMKDVDNLVVWKKLIGDWMKTEDFEALDPGFQEVAKNLLAGVVFLQQQEAQEQVAAQTAQAETLGLKHAAKAPEAKPLPSQPKPT